MYFRGTPNRQVEKREREGGKERERERGVERGRESPRACAGESEHTRIWLHLEPLPFPAAAQQLLLFIKHDLHHQEEINRYSLCSVN